MDASTEQPVSDTDSTDSHTVLIARQEPGQAADVESKKDPSVEDVQASPSVKREPQAPVPFDMELSNDDVERLYDVLSATYPEELDNREHKPYAAPTVQNSNSKVRNFRLSTCQSGVPKRYKVPKR